MKIVVVSDIHANYDAWSRFAEHYDEMWILGDLVNYGPQPGEVIETAINEASLIIQGNHDYAVAHDYDSSMTMIQDGVRNTGNYPLLLAALLLLPSLRNRKNFWESCRNRYR